MPLDPKHQLGPCVPVLYAPDLEVTLRFWVDQLGFEELFTHGEPPEIVGVRHGDHVQVNFWKGEVISNKACWLYLFASHIDELYATYEAAGIDMAMGLEDKPWGLREFAVRDPNGYLVAFGEFL